MEVNLKHMSDIINQLLLQFVLILLNAFFAATEIAVISLNERKVRARAEEGDKKAAKMMRMIENPTQFLSTIQIGITLAGFLGSAFAADNFATRLSDFTIKVFNIPENSAAAINTLAVIVITLILSFFTLVFGELVPKRIAMKHKEKLAEKVCGIISFLSSVLRPFIFLLTLFTNSILKVAGIDPYEKDEPVSKEDIVLMLDAGADDGSFDSSDIEYIKNVFKLEKMTARSVMTPRKSVISISCNAKLSEIPGIIEKTDFSRIPVIDDEKNIVGILHARDFLLKYQRECFRMEEAMTEPVFVPETSSADQLLAMMQKEQRHLVVVINEYGDTSGIVTMEDIFEELVGEIWDEYEQPVEEITVNEDGSYKVLCSAGIDDFFELTGMEKDEKSDVTTVNGWIIEYLGEIPEKGRIFEFENSIIEITKADNTMTHEIIVRKKEKNSGE